MQCAWQIRKMRLSSTRDAFLLKANLRARWRGGKCVIANRIALL